MEPRSGILKQRSTELIDLHVGLCSPRIETDTGHKAAEDKARLLVHFFLLKISHRVGWWGASRAAVHNYREILASIVSRELLGGEKSCFQTYWYAWDQGRHSPELPESVHKLWPKGRNWCSYHCKLVVVHTLLRNNKEQHFISMPPRLVTVEQKPWLNLDQAAYMHAHSTNHAATSSSVLHCYLLGKASKK